MGEPLLIVENLTVEFPGKGGFVPVVDGASFSIDRGETLAVVGESGSGKSLSALAVMRLLPKPGQLGPNTKIMFDGRDVVNMSVLEMRDVRGDEMAMIFQEPMTSLNPVTTVGQQVAEAVHLHEDVSRAEARRRVVQAFEMVGIPDPELRYSVYPHQLSGGLKQRVMIAMAMIMRPQLLIADEPTTALDVTVQAQILELLRNLAKENNTAILLITHDFGVVNEAADRVAVMYAGRIVEQGNRSELLTSPRHPYTQGLLGAIPRPDATGTDLHEISGVVPRPGEWPAGCRFETRCQRAFSPCRDTQPPNVAFTDTHMAVCHAVTEDA